MSIANVEPSRTVKHTYYWLCLIGFSTAFVLNEVQVVEVSFLSDHFSNFVATGLVATLVAGPSSFNRWSHSALWRIASITLLGVAIELLVDGPIYLYETESMKLLGFINTADLLDASFGLFGGLTVILIMRLADRARRSQKEAAGS